MFNLDIDLIRIKLAILRINIIKEKNIYKRERLGIKYDKLENEMFEYIKLKDLQTFTEANGCDFSTKNILEKMILTGSFSLYNIKRFLWKKILLEFNENYPELNIKTKKQLLNYIKNFRA